MTSPAWLDPALKIIREFEGFEAKAYPDPGTGGRPFTIGWGFTRMPDGSNVRPTDVISRTEADLMLGREVAAFGAGLQALIKPRQALNANQFAALVSWAYNVGLGNVESSTLRKRLNAGEDANTVAREELPRWNRGGSGVMPGLTRRRAAEAALFASTPGLVPPPQQLTTIAGMVGPSKSPRDFGMKGADTHLIVNDRAQTMTAWSGAGLRLWLVPALARGQGRDDQWEAPSTDTPPGLYRLGAIYNDIARVGPSPAYDRTLAAYGWVSIDMIELENQEARYGRAGIMIHGGGSSLGWPGAWAPEQPLVPTLGCIRVWNRVLRDQILPLMKTGTVFCSVFQEAKG